MNVQATNVVSVLNSKKTCSSRGMSLIEILVAVAILGALTLLFVMGTQKIRQTMAQTSCIAKLQNIHSAIQQYIQDNNHHFPGYGSDLSENTRWFARLLPYFGYTPTTTWHKMPVVRHPYSFDEFFCPSRDINPEIGGRYGFNTRLQRNYSGSEHGLLGVRTSMVPDPTRVPMVIEKFGANLTTNVTAPYPVTNNGVSANHRHDNNPKNGPDGNSNYLFVDGHIETRSSWIGAEAFVIE